jgi:hypothetical protein
VRTVKSKTLLYAGAAVAVGALAYFTFFRHVATTVPSGPLAKPVPGPNLPLGATPLSPGVSGPNQPLSIAAQAIGVASLGTDLLRKFGLFGSSGSGAASPAFGSTPQVWTGSADELGI